MKLNIEAPSIELSEDLKSSMFSIGDHSLIFDVLRSKMYSNPILVICREYLCNAIDAHIEIGDKTTPIQITLPNTLEPSLRIRDWGPGISPDRVENIFIRYGSSTKRDSNDLIGSFGLGSKSSFSYSDTFSVNTIHSGIKYCYCCVIDETKVGKIITLSQNPTTEPNGTEIVIPIKPNDFQAIKNGIEFISRHWSVKPIIKGDKIVYQTITPSLSGKNWAIVKSDNYYNKRDIKLIVGSAAPIEYPLDISSLKTYSNTKLLDAIFGTIFLYFETGELSLAANRESVHLDKKTQDKINDKLTIVSQDLKDSVQTKIASLSNLWEANVYLTNELSKTFGNIAFLGTLQWQGINLTSNSIYIDSTISEFYKSKSYSRDDRISKSTTRYLSFKDKSSFYYNDLDIKDLTVKHISTAFTNDKALQSIQIINIPEKMTWESFCKKYHFDKMDCKKVSEIAKSVRKSSISGARLLVFKFDTSALAFKQVAYSLMEEDANNKVLCRLERDEYNGSRRVFMKNRSVVTGDILKSVLDNTTKYSIYGVDKSLPEDKIKEHFEGFSTLDEFVSEKIFEGRSTNYLELKYVVQNQYVIAKTATSLVAQFKKMIKDPDSLYLKNIDLHSKLKDLLNKDVGLLKVYEIIKGIISDKDINDWIKANPDKDIKKMQEKVNAAYPLINSIDHYYHEKLIEPISHYINLVDREDKEEKD